MRNSIFNISKIFLSLIILSGFVFAQEIGIYGSKTWTDHYEIQNPIGTGIKLSKSFMNENLSVRVNYSHHWSSREYTDRVISGFMLPENMSEIERIESKSGNTAYEMGLSFRAIRWWSISLYVGAGFVFAQFEGERSGLTTGLTKKLSTTNKYGYALEVSVHRSNFFLQQVVLFSSLKYHLLHGGMVATDIENTFSGEFSKVELSYGLSYKFKD